MSREQLQQFHVNSSPRHLHLLFFISSDSSHAELLELMCKNQQFWGGIYNPMIPVTGNTIAPEYLALLKYYDPDYIYYGAGINIDFIKTLGFNPKEYLALHEPTQEAIYGVDAYYLLSRYPKNTKILQPRQLYTSGSPLLNYYELNFGIRTNVYHSDIELTKEYEQIGIGPDEVDQLHEIIYREKPFNKIVLGKQNIVAPLLRCIELHYTDFEIIIAKAKDSTSDLLYFWNRRLYGGKGFLYLTLEELYALKSDQYFWGVLYDLSGETCHVVSLSIEQDELRGIIADVFRKSLPQLRFAQRCVSVFPYEIRDGAGVHYSSHYEGVTQQLVITRKGLFQIPKLSFASKIGYFLQKWALDIHIEEINSFSRSQFKFPITTDAAMFFQSPTGRINGTGRISLIISSQDEHQGVDINIAGERQIFHQLVTHPIIHGKRIDTSFKEVRLNDSSNRLNAFIRAFKNNFDTIDDFFSDIFWVGIFEGLIKNNRMAGDAISFEEIKEQCLKKLGEYGTTLKDRDESNENEHNLEIGLKHTLSELCSYQVFFKGFNLKCTNCSSIFWYHINDVSETLQCKGCFHKFPLKVEPSFHYKLNDLIKNNIFQNKQQRDGNLTVIRTLAYLKKQSRISFLYHPQIDLYKNYWEKAYTDIDIVCILDGKFVIGEAKHSSKAFFEKNSRGQNSLDVLAEIAFEIFPDIIVISCYEDEKNKLQNALTTLSGKFHQKAFQPKIVAKLLTKPDEYNFGGHRYFHY